MKIEKKTIEDDKFTPYQLIINVEDVEDEAIISSLRQESLNETLRIVKGFDSAKDRVIAGKIEYLISIIEEYIDKKYREKVMNRRWSNME